MSVILEISYKALVQLLISKVITNDSFKFKEVFYSDGDVIKQSCIEENFSLKDIDGIEVV